MTHLSSYIQAALISVLFLAFISGDIGWALLYTLVGIGLISVVTLLVSVRNFSVELPEFIGTAEHGSSVSFDVRLNKTGFCFIPFIELDLVSGSEHIKVQASLLFSSSAVIKVTVSPEKCGINRITAEKVRMWDMWRVICCKRPVSACTRVAVLPLLSDYRGPEVFPKNHDSEECADSRTVFTSGTPGCEHREYIAGDRLNCIDYKCSAKHGRLMVRLNENSTAAPVSIQLSGDCDTRCAEQALALVHWLTTRGGRASISYRESSFSADSPEMTEHLREWLAYREFDGTYAHEPQEVPSDADVMISPSGIFLK